MELVSIFFLSLCNAITLSEAYATALGPIQSSMRKCWIYSILLWPWGQNGWIFLGCWYWAVVVKERLYVVKFEESKFWNRNYLVIQVEKKFITERKIKPMWWPKNNKYTASGKIHHKRCKNQFGFLIFLCFFMVTFWPKSHSFTVYLANKEGGL